MKYLTLGSTRIGPENIPMLAKCVHKTDELFLNDCKMKANQCNAIFNEVKTRTQPVREMSCIFAN